jgi:hypothetical protein
MIFILLLLLCLIPIIATILFFDFIVSNFLKPFPRTLNIILIVGALFFLFYIILKYYNWEIKGSHSASIMKFLGFIFYSFCIAQVGRLKDVYIRKSLRVVGYISSLLILNLFLHQLYGKFWDTILPIDPIKGYSPVRVELFPGSYRCEVYSYNNGRDVFGYDDYGMYLKVHKECGFLPFIERKLRLICRFLIIHLIFPLKLIVKITLTGF